MFNPPWAPQKKSLTIPDPSERNIVINAVTGLTIERIERATIPSSVIPVLQVDFSLNFTGWRDAGKTLRFSGLPLLDHKIIWFWLFWFHHKWFSGRKSCMMRIDWFPGSTSTTFLLGNLWKPHSRNYRNLFWIIYYFK